MSRRLAAAPVMAALWRRSASCSPLSHRALSSLSASSQSSSLLAGSRVTVSASPLSSSPLFLSSPKSSGLCSPVLRCPLCRSFASTATAVSSTVEEDGSHNDFKPKAKLASSPAVSSSSSPSSAVIASDVSSHAVFLYMKGSPASPKCGFSANVVRILQHLSASFSSRDVLEDAEVREAVKAFSDWPTLPQLYVGGEFIGGSDIITQLFKSGELEKRLAQAGAIQPRHTEKEGDAGAGAQL